jgi:hypothetical protein
MTLLKKIKWTIGILMLFLLILATNLIDRSNFIKVKESISSIYEDRLVANDILFKMSGFLNEKKFAILSNDTPNMRSTLKQTIKLINSQVDKFEETTLTREEGTLLFQLKESRDGLISISEELVISSNERIISLLDNMNESIFLLADIQLTEGDKQLEKAERAIEKIELFTQMEIYILIVLAIVVQIIIMYQPNGKDAKKMT